MKINRRKLIIGVAILDMGIVGGLGYAFRYKVIPKRFAEVEAGQLYRAGYCEPGPLARVLQKHHIKTVLILLQDDGSEKQKKEEDLLSREGVKAIRVGMPGDGVASFPDLEEAAAVIADPANRPLLVHCAAGVNRTGAAYAVYRMKYCGWSFEKALAEMEYYGYSQKETPQLRDHLKRYAEQRAAETQPASEPRRTEKRKRESFRPLGRNTPVLVLQGESARSIWE